MNKEKVRELATELATVLKKAHHLNYYEHIKIWLEQNQPEPVIVGLSDEQVKELVEVLYNKTDVSNPHEPEFHIKKWLKKQTFAQPESILSNNQVYSELYQEYMVVKSELEQLKSQQFTPDWNTSPDWANWLAQDSDGQWQWYEDKPVTYEINWSSKKDNDSAHGAVKSWKESLQERPKPTPQVEVGQIWMCLKNGLHYEISSVGKLKSEISGGWDDSVNYIYVAMDGTVMNPNPYTHTMSNFLAKFERVGA